MSKQDREQYDKWLKKAEKAEQILWELYDEEIEGDDNVANYALSAFRSTNQLAERISKEVE